MGDALPHRVAIGETPPDVCAGVRIYLDDVEQRDAVEADTKLNYVIVYVRDDHGYFLADTEKGEFVKQKLYGSVRLAWAD